MTIINRVINFLNPPKCIYCHAQLMDQAGFCMACWADMNFISQPICDVTGTPLPFGMQAEPGEKSLSLEALNTPPIYDKARIAVKFNDHSKTLIHKLKYYDQQHIAPLMAKMMVNAAVDLLGECRNNIVCPVPLYHWRYFTRRFNQADILARNIAKLTDTNYMPALIKRQKSTKTQVTLSRKERRINVKDAFVISDKLLKKVHGKNIFIVDDVITTGATVDEVAKCLKAVGLGPIYVIAFAKVIKKQVI